jgi:flagellar biosynthesis protein FlhG
MILDQAASLRRLANHANPVASSTRPRVVTVTSGKGGVGKSTLAVNLAYYLSQSGNNVLLVDADANLGCLDLMFGIAPKWRMRHVLQDEVEPEEALVSPFPRLKVLAGSSGDANYPMIDLDRQNRFIREMTSTEERFDIVLIDTAAGLSKEIVNYAIHSDDVLVVTNSEPTSVMDAYAVMKMIWASDSEIPIGFLMNGVRVHGEAEEAAEKLQMAVTHFLKIKVRYLGTVPFDESVSLSIVHQRPIAALFPFSAAALSIQSLATKFHSRSVSKHNAVRKASL